MNRLSGLFSVLLLSGCVVSTAPARFSVPPPGPAYAPPAGGIEIVSGTYGSNCGAPRGNVVADLAGRCGGRGACAYRVDYQVIGDPAVGCGKDYVAEWRCSGSPEVFSVSAGPEAGYGSIVELACPPTGAAMAVPPPPPPAPAPPGAGPIRIVAGSYGQNCHAAYGNKTPHLQQSCEGRDRCAYRVDYRTIGDPAVGCAKDYVAEWTCGADSTVHRAVAGPEAGYGSVLNLVCGR